MKPHQKSTVVTLLQNGVSQREIWRKTGIDRKTIRKLAQETEAEANSPMATGSPGRAGQIPPPRPPALAPGPSPPRLPAHARSAREPHRAWVEAQGRLGRNAPALHQHPGDRVGL